MQSPDRVESQSATNSAEITYPNVRIRLNLTVRELIQPKKYRERESGPDAFGTSGRFIQLLLESGQTLPAEIREALIHPEQTVFRCTTNQYRQDIVGNAQLLGRDTPIEWNSFWYKVGRPLLQWAWPEDHTVTSYILLYKFDPKLFPSDETHIFLPDKPTNFSQRIKDAFIGYIEITWV